MDPFAPDIPDVPDLAADPLADPGLPAAEPLPLIPVGPKRKPGWKKPPKPAADDVLADAELHAQLHRARLRQQSDYLKRVAGEVNVFFEAHREMAERGEMDPWHSSDLHDEHHAAVRVVGTMDWQVEVLYRDMVDQDEAAATEDTAAYSVEVETRQHARAGRGTYRAAVAEDAVCGMLAGFDGLDIDDDEIGLDMRLIDPNTVFPVFAGKRGLKAVYRVYDADPQDVVGNFDAGDGKVERKVRRILGDDDRPDPRALCRVVEYWDDHWTLVALDGQHVATFEHGYGHNPFTVRYLCAGQPGHVARPDASGGDTIANLLAGGGSGAGRERDLARIAEPFLWHRVAGHEQDEMIGAVLQTAFRRTLNPAMVLQQDAVSMNLLDVEPSMSEGEVNRIGAGDTLSAFTPEINQAVIQPLLGMSQQNRLTSMAQGVLNGQAPPQTSGSAMDIMQQSGWDKFTPLVAVIEDWAAERIEKRLALLRDWGAVIPAMDGGLPIPARAANPRLGTSKVHTVTPEVLERTGIRVTVNLQKVNLSSLAQLANGLAIVNSMGVIDKRSIIKMTGITNDPEAMLKRIEIDQFDDVPEFKQARFLEWLGDQAAEARARGDEQSFRDLTDRAQFIASMMGARMADARMQGQMAEDGMPPPEDGPLPGLPPGSEIGPAPGTPPQPQPYYDRGPGPSPVMAQGMSLPGMGMPPGTDGGRPMGT